MEEESPRRRIPPGQYLVEEMPVLHIGRVPRFDPDTWTFRVFGLVSTPLELTYARIRAMPAVRIQTDIHCVTHWTMLDTVWEGVRAGDILAQAGRLPEARFVLVHAEGGYTTNLPLDELLDEDVLLAYRFDDVDLRPEHGYPLRLLVPKLYLWKSAKWVRGFELMDHDEAGFWESRGYHNHGDPWKEERYS